jgi:hypothetical protein
LGCGPAIRVFGPNVGAPPGRCWAGLLPGWAVAPVPVWAVVLLPGCNMDPVVPPWAKGLLGVTVEPVPVVPVPAVVVP